MIEIDRSTRFKNMLIMTVLIVLLLGTIYFLSYPDFFGLEIPSLYKVKSVEKVGSDVLSVQSQSVFQDIAKPFYGFPQKVTIKSIGIEANVIPVGVDVGGFLETPKQWNEAGWYKKGSKPSELGNMIINAHYDDNYGRPAAFWNLKNISIGDKVSVLDSYNRVFNYLVTKVYYVGVDDPNRTDVFEAYEDGKSLLTLITCGGVWSTQDGTYSKRLVVNAELIQ
jgi:LPXTG-site transpeptidase (sortase) family protein